MGKNGERTNEKIRGGNEIYNNGSIQAKKCLSLPFISRLAVGTIFIYAALHIIINPDSFEKTLRSYNFLSNSFTGFIVSTFPWAQLILGALLISGYLSRYVSSIISIILTIFIVMNLLNVSKGNCQTCCFLSELMFYKHASPFILLTINYLLLALLASIVLDKLFYPNKAQYSFFKQVVLPLSIFFVVYLNLCLFTFIGRRSYEAKYISAVSGERDQIVKELSKPENLSLIGSDIKSISSNIEFPKNPEIKIMVILTLHSLECSSCADEAAYLEYLSVNHGEKAYFCAVVPKIGKTAIDNFRNEYGITYPLIEDPILLGSNILSRYKSLILIVSPDGKILRIDPINFNVKKFRDEYEKVLLSYLK